MINGGLKMTLLERKIYYITPLLVISGHLVILTLQVISSSLQSCSVKGSK